MSRRRYAPPTILNVGAGIPDGPGWSVPWTRQGCRVLRNSYAFAPVRRSTTPGTARRHTQVPPYEWDGSLFGVRGKRESRRPPPREGWGRRLWGRRKRPRGLRHLRMALWTTGDFARSGGRVFRWLRPAGISPRARGDQRLCLWKPRFFEKNRVKLLILGALGVTAYYAGTPKSLPRWYPASPWA